MDAQYLSQKVNEPSELVKIIEAARRETLDMITAADTVLAENQDDDPVAAGQSDLT